MRDRTRGQSAPGTVSEAIRRHAADRPDALALHDLTSGLSLDYQRLDRLVDATCHYLASFGLDAGDRVALVLDNSLEFCLLSLASLRFGAVVSPQTYGFIAREILADLESMPPAAVFVSRERAPEFGAGAAGGFVVAVPPDEAFVDVVAGFERGPWRAPDPGPIACLYPSCGDERDPRGILFTHANLEALIPSICRGFGLSAADRHLVVLPLAHTAAINYALLPAWWTGAGVVLARGFWPIRDRFWDLAATHRITRVQVVPTVLVMLMHLPGRPAASLALPYVGCGSAPLSRETQLEFEEMFGLRVANLYGLSETGPTHVDDPTEPGWTAGSIGRPLDVNEVAILGPDGTPCPDGREGEIGIRGDNVFPGYVVNPQAARASFVDGFFRTGDLGRRDPGDGRYYFTGRRKRLIIKGAINIHPSEIDRVLLAHPAVASVSTSGTPDRYLGEAITTVVRVRPGSGVSETALRAYCRERLSPLKVPDVLRLDRA